MKVGNGSQVDIQAGELSYPTSMYIYANECNSTIYMEYN